MKLVDRSAMQAGTWLGSLHGKPNVDFLIVEQLLDLILTRLDQSKPESTTFVLESSEKCGQVFPLNEFRGRDAQAFVSATGNAGAKFGKAAEEGFDMLEE